MNGEPCDHSAQGEFVEKITLPDAVERIENAAFFNCKKLYALEVGKCNCASIDDIIAV